MPASPAEFLAWSLAFVLVAVGLAARWVATWR